MHRLVSLVFSAAAIGCVASSGDEGFNVIHNLDPGANCAPVVSAPYIPSGTLQIDSPSGYELTPAIESRIVDNGTPQRTIALRGAKVEVSVEAVTVDGVSQTGVTLSQPNFQSLFAASLAPTGTVATSFTGISAQQVAELNSKLPTGVVNVQLLAKVTPYGALGGSGDTIEGVPFFYPVTVCTDCVVRVVGACSAFPENTKFRDDVNGCNLFQDGQVECCISATGGLVCPGTGTAPNPAQ